MSDKSNADEYELAQKAREGDQEALCALIEQNRERLFALAYNAFVAAVLAEYLQQPLAVEEEAWARYEYIVILTALGRNAEMVRHQRAALIWGRARWEAGQLQSKPFLQFISNSSLAEPWAALGLLDEWLDLLTGILEIIPPDADNRMERFHALRSACLRLQHAGRYEAAFAVTEQIRAMADEDPQWKQAYELRVQADLAALRLYLAQGNREEAFALAKHATTLLDEQEPEVANMTRAERLRLMIQYDNVAAALFFAQQYALSIPLHRRSLELGYDREYAYLWMAAALWAQYGERSKALELLRQGRVRTRSVETYRADFAELSEFQDVKDDPDFLAAVTGNV